MIAPDVTPWPFDDVVTFDCVEHRVAWIDAPTHVADRYVRLGLGLDIPTRFLDELLRAAQTSPAPHGWRVGETMAEEDVDEAVLVRARELYREDARKTRARFVSFFGEDSKGSIHILGCAAARTCMSPAYDSRYFVALTRLQALPTLRGIGLGTSFHMLFFGASQTLGGRPALGCFLPTDSEQVRRLTRRAAESGLLDVVQNGGKVIHQPDGIYEVEVFLALYPGMRSWIEMHAAQARANVCADARLHELLEATDRAWKFGYSIPEGVILGECFAHHEAALRAAAARSPGLFLYLDFLDSARAFGTFDGVGTESSR
jgi:hypothetical protein